MSGNPDENHYVRSYLDYATGKAEMLALLGPRFTDIANAGRP